ncbi:hypothetical protein PV10_09020 [Exophiala mesophila]|uniref:PHD-type domain-containing protein n=1 Tax=Exophiala mesophila TaxID=212818 RepID=A0A0D1ZMV4_EXOME|nr:uncharacterized protein PV10_09020 [Exophiala mesophila]KIV88093.1 hypothetical protein PV10_09020 [Exophiala mesophila]
MPFTLNELLNPTSTAVHELNSTSSMDSHESPSKDVAPGVLESDPTSSTDAQDTLAAIAQTATNALETHSLVPAAHDDVEMTDVSLVKQEQPDDPSLPTHQSPSPSRQGSPSQHDSTEPTSHHSPSLSRDTPNKSLKQRKHPGKSKPELTANKSSIHSSKNEGQHTDRRYLCYFCNKLFTRRRSVRDHISKIHNTKTWEPLRSLEIVVEPISGEPLEPLEDIISRGPPPPPPKPAKSEPRQSFTKQDESTQDLSPVANEEESPQPDIPTTVATEPSRPTTSVTSLKKEPSLVESRASSSEPSAIPAPVAGKKRPPPNEPSKPASAALKKKGIAKPKPTPASNKRQKISDTEHSSSLARSPLRSPSATPSSNHVKPLASSKLKNQTLAASVRSSPTPSLSRDPSVRSISRSSSVAATPESSNDDGEVFCICRKGDNHTWMIACDGGCEEWYHGNCVNIRERDGDLIDKYICPTCTRPGLHTTWKRMCRRKDCRKPARVTQDPPSKYCSDACGRMFFVELVQRGDPTVQSSRDGQSVLELEKPKKVRKKPRRVGNAHTTSKPTAPQANGGLGEPTNEASRLATPAYSEDEKSEYETDSSVDDDMLPNRGGPLRAGEVKALLERCKTIDEWKFLGRKPATPPRDMDENDSKEPVFEHDELELDKIASIEEQMRTLNAKSELLSAREGLLDLIKTRSSSITDEVKKSNAKSKPCGFDPRLAWSDEEFSRWYVAQGKAILDAGDKGKIGPPDDDELVSDKGANGLANGASNHHAGTEDEEEDNMPKKGGVCVKNNCQRHKNWAKGQLAEVRFEQDLVRRSLARLEAQLYEFRQRAMVRAWERRG